MNVILVILGLGLLVLGGELLVRSSVAISLKFSIPKIIIGMTIVSFATSAPELLVSLQAALNGSPAIAINNVVGSNIANLGLVLGVTAMIGAIDVNKSFYRIDWPILLVFSLVFYYFLYNDSILSFYEGLLLFLGLIAFIILILKSPKESVEIEEVDDELQKENNFKIIFWLVGGALALYFGSELLVENAKEIAINLGVSEAVISITLIAIGTSVPELAASVIAALRGEKAISIGNLVGSNIFNIASVLGLTAMIKEIPVTDASILNRDIYWMIAFVIILLILVLVPKKLKISRVEGVILFLTYLVFVYFTLF